MLFIKSLLDFSKPKFLNFDHTDILVEEKALLLVSWKSKRHYKVKISPPNKTYHSHETAVVLKIPTNTTKVTISLYSLWRKRRYNILLKKVKLDKETAQHLITKFKPVEMLRLKTPAIKTIKTLKDTNLPIIIPKECRFSIKTPFISINADKLTYSSKTNYYE